MKMDIKSNYTRYTPFLFYLFNRRKIKRAGNKLRPLLYLKLKKSYKIK